MDHLYDLHLIIMVLMLPLKIEIYFLIVLFEHDNSPFFVLIQNFSLKTFTTNLMYGSTKSFEVSTAVNKANESNRIYKSLAIIICVSVSLIGISTLFTRSNVDTKTELLSGDIRGGVDASGQDYPWMASWRYEDIHCCTGSLINQNPPIVATAAHCVSCEQTTIDLKRTLTDSQDNTAETHNILYWIQHPDYEQPTISSHDLALVVLDGTTDIEPIPMVPPKVSQHNVYPTGTIMDIFGYGYIDEDDTIISTQLQKGVIYSWDKNECFNYLNVFCDYGERWDNDAMLCGYDPNTSTERGDSGGPAIMNGYLSGINSWSPPSEQCEAIAGPDYQIVDVFVDIGSVRHWIEDTIPALQTYFVGIHLCDDAPSAANSLSAILYGSNGKSSSSVKLNNSQLTSSFLQGDFNLFVINDIDNIGWAVDSITFESLSSTDSVCIDMVVSGRLNGPELVTGSTQNVLINTTDEYPVDLKKRCGYPGALSANAPSVSAIQANYYSVIIHVCGSEITSVGGSVDNIYARMHGSYGSSEWFQLINSAMSTLFVQDGTFIFNVNIDYDIGDNIDSVEFQSESNDALCVDMVTAGNTRYPYLWKGSHERFFIDSPCSVNPINGIDCVSLKSVQLTCYDYE
eukprot:163480_1